MGRGPKPTKGKAKPAARKSPKDEGATVHDLEERLEEALRDCGQSSVSPSAPSLLR